MASSGERVRCDAALVVEVVRRLVQVELGALLHGVRIATTEAALVLERLVDQLLGRERGLLARHERVAGPPI